MWSPNVYIKRYPVSLHFRSKWEVGDPAAPADLNADVPLLRSGAVRGVDHGFSLISKVLAEREDSACACRITLICTLPGLPHLHGQAAWLLSSLLELQRAPLI